MTLVIGALALPGVDVLCNHRITEHLEQLFQQKGNVVPALRLNDLRERMLGDIPRDVPLLVAEVIVIGSAHIAMARQT